MSSYFHGWRRKLGVLTLVPAIVALGLAIRSLAYSDFILTQRGNTLWRLESMRQSVAWSRFYGTNHYGYYVEVSTDPTNSQDGDWIQQLPDKHWRFCGFHLLDETGFSAHTTQLVVPDMPVFISLTFVGAWLLLSKSRTPIKPQNNPDTSPII